MVVRGTAILVACAILVLVAFGERIENRIRLAIERRIAGATGGVAVIGTLDIEWSRLAVVVSDLRIEVPADGGEVQPLTIVVERGRVRLAPGALLAIAGRRLRLAEVDVEGAAVELDQAWLDARERGPRGDRAFDVRVDRLAVRTSSFRYRDREIPVDVVARDADIRGEWSAFRRALIGRVRASADLNVDLFRDPYPLTAEAGIRLSDARVEIYEGRASGPGLEVALREQVVSWDGPTFLTAEGDARVDLDVLAPLLDAAPAGLGGRAAGAVSCSLGAGPVQVRADLEATDFTLGPIKIRSARVDAVLDPGVVHFAVREAVGLGGVLSGQVDVGYRGGTALDVDVRGERIAASAVLAMLDVPLPLSGAGPARLRFRGDPNRPESWVADGSFRMEAVAGPVGRIPSAGSGTFAIDRGLLTLEVPDASMAATRLHAVLVQDLVRGTGTLSLEGRTDDARATQIATDRILSGLGVELPGWLGPGAALAGTGTIGLDAVLGGTTDVGIAIDLADGSWDGDPFRRLAVSARIADEEVAVSRIEAVADPWFLRGSLTVDTASASVRSAEFEWVGLPIDLATRRAGIDAPALGGTTDGAIVVRESERGLEGTGRARVRDVEYAGERIDEAEAAFVARAGRAVFTDLSATGPAIRLRGDLDVDVTGESAHLEIGEGVVELGKLTAVAASGFAVNARLDVSGALDVRPESVVGTLRLTGEEWSVGERLLPALQGQVDLLPGGAEIRLASRDGSRWSAFATVDWDSDLSLDASVDLRKLGIDVLTDPAAPSVGALLSGRIEVRGPASRPEDLVVQGTLVEAELRVGSRIMRAQEAVPVGFRGGRWTLGPTRFEGRGSRVEVALDAAGDGADLLGTARGHVDLGVLTALVTDVTASGRVDLDLRVAGGLDDLSTTGSLDIAGGRVRFLGFDQPLEDLAMRVRLTGDEAEIDDLRGILGGGELRGSGGVLLDGIAVDSYRFEIDAANVRIAYPEHFRAVYEGQLVLRGDSEAAELGGSISLLRGEYTQPIDLTSLVSTGSREYSTSEELALPARVYLDVDLVSDGNLWIRNDLIEAESDFDLHVGGDLRNPEVLGRLRAFEGGEMRFRDVDYRIDSATLDFLDLQKIDPYLNLRAHARVKDYEIELHIEGKVERFTYELTSNPVLSQQDIIALLTTGQTLEELTASGGSQAFTGDLATGYFAGALTSRFERQLQQALRVERLQISPLLVRGSGDPTARVTVGKEVADDFLLIYSSELGGTQNQLYQIEWRASRKFRITGERDTLGGIGGEVRYSDHFWWRKPPTPDYGRRERTAREVGPAVAFVGNIDIEGVAPGDREEIRGRIPIQDGDPYRRSVLFEGSQRVRAWYVREGRLEARVEVDAVPRPGSPDRIDVSFRVEPGPRVDVAVVGVDGRHRRRILAKLRQRWNETLFTDALFDDSVETINAYWRERGYYTVETRVQVEDDPGGRRSVTFFVDPGRPVRITEVVIEGNHEIERDRIERQMLTRAGGSLGRRLLVPGVLQEDVRAVRNLYRDQGFLDVEVFPPAVRLSLDGDSARVVLRVEEGPRARIAAITVPDPPPEFPPDRLVAWSGLHIGEVFAPRRLIEAESALRVELDRRGYPDARIAARAERAEQGIEPRLEVVPGPRRVVGEVEVRGNFATKNYVVTRELALQRGDPISREAILRTQHALYRLGIFRNVRIDYAPMGGGDPELNVVRIEVEEAPPFGVTVGFGYDSEAQFKTSFGVSHANVGGRDRTLSLQGRKSGIEERVQLIAEEPRLFTWRLPALVSLLDERREQPEFTEKRRAAAFRVERRFSDRWTGYLRYNFQRVDLRDVDPAALDSLREQKLENLVLGDVGTSVVRDTRDDPFAPTTGSIFSADLRWFAEPLASQRDFLKLFTKYGTSWTRRNGVSFAAGVRLGVASPYGGTLQVPLSERFFAGGDSSLRGFPRDAVLPEGGEALFLVNGEWRVPLWRSLRGVLFYDGGNVYPRAGDLDPSDLRHVLGAGLRFETPIGPLRFEYGHKLDRRDGESAGEYFIAIGSAF